MVTMLRTTPPPEGIGSLLKVSDFGSKRTSVFFEPSGFRIEPSELVRPWPVY